MCHTPASRENAVLMLSTCVNKQWTGTLVRSRDVSSVKYADIYIKNYDTASELKSGLREYFDFYNNNRHHQS